MQVSLNSLKLQQILICYYNLYNIYNNYNIYPGLDISTKLK